VHARLIVNPRASTVTEPRVAAVEAELRRLYEVDVARTERPLHATELARGLATDVVAVFGGDGLLNEVVNGLDGSIPLAIVPGGGKNVVARTLGIPLEPADAARALARAEPRQIGLGRVNGRRFVFAAGLGFDAELVRRVDALGRSVDGRRPGDVAFIREAVKVLRERRGRYEPVLEIDGLGRAAFAFVSNADPYSYVGGRPLHVAPKARFELGLDLVAPRRVHPGSIPRLLGLALLGRGQEGAPDVAYAHDRDGFVIRCDRPLPLQADGEDLGDVTEAIFEAERDALPVLVPG
jgi:diacylglycerol kinase family enzyme